MISNSFLSQSSYQNHRAIWALAWPMILSNISLPLLGLIDTAILGHLDSAIYLGAVAVGSSIITFILWAFAFLRMGTTSLSARAYGANQYQKMRLLLSQSILLALFLGICITLLLPFGLSIALKLMNPSPDVLIWAESYCQIRLLSAPASLMMYAIVGWLIGQQNTRGPLIILLLTNCINIVLDWLFIIHWDYLSDGAAWATVIAEYCGVLLALYLVNKQLKTMPGKTDKKELFQIKNYFELLKVNRHLFVRTVSLLLVFAFFTSRGAQTNDIVLAANAILLQLVLFISYGLDGFAHAAEALVGKAIGAKDKALFKLTCINTTVWALITAMIFFLICIIFKETIVTSFSHLNPIIETTEKYYWWLCLMPLIGIWSYQLDGIFIGAGKTLAMQNTMVLATFFIFFPLWWSTQDYGNHGLWFSFSVFILARAILLGAVFWRNTFKGLWF